MNSYSCLTDVIVIFHSLSDFSTAIGRYPNIILMISCHTFFLSKNIACNSSVSAFMTRASNFIMKSAVFFFSCLKVSIFYSTSAALVLSLNVFFISYTKLSQFWVLISLSSLSSFLWAQIPAMLPLRWTRIAVILSLFCLYILSFFLRLCS